MFNLFRHLETRASCVRNWKIFRYSRYILFEKMSQEELLNLSLYDLHIQRAKKSLSSKTYHEIQLSSVTQSCLTLSDPWTATCQASLSLTNSWSFLKLMSIESVMPSNHLILCRPLLLSPQSFLASGSFPMSQLFASGGQSIGVSASTSNEQSGLIFFRMY